MIGMPAPPRLGAALNHLQARLNADGIGSGRIGPGVAKYAIILGANALRAEALAALETCEAIRAQGATPFGR
ncbi:hypothetical protein CLG85_003265 [Yangia mangrovi]|uniref:Uncharacterized protein n=1 Tax=Alloyangia mangrovi TaxID=1779329 RepID=A0A2A3JSL2_9RHOB|nr:hypothetical protein [Alloyangia mangrovi]MCT4369413.1 hypothetical protein [Alloyangia mangrovi]